MKCKYCQAELEPNSSVCPQCGKDNLKDSLKGLKIVTLVLVCLVMLVLLAGLVCYGVTGSFIPNFGGSDATDSTGETTEGTLSAEDQAFLDAMDDVVATMGDYQLKNSEMQLYYWLVAYNDENVDLTVSLEEQIYDEETGKTYHEYCMEEAVNAWQEIMLMSDAAKNAGYEMSEEWVSNLESMKTELEYYVEMYAYYGYDISTVDDLIQMQFGPGCTYDDYYNYTYHYYYGALYWTDMIESFEVTEDEINAYFEENEEALANDYSISVTKDFGNFVDVRNILIAVPTTDEGEEDWDACLSSAQAVLDAWKAGDMTEESFIALVPEYSEDGNTNEYEGLYTDIYKNSMAEVDVRHILITPEGGTLNDDGKTYTYTEEEWAAAAVSAQELLDQWLAGDKTEESFAELANTHSADSDGVDGGLYTDVYVGQMVEPFEDWCFDESRQVGDYGIVKTTYGYHIMYFVRADREMDNWINAEERVAGDVEMVKTDAGYQILYYVTAEPAWYRYSRYGAQTVHADALLDELIGNNPVTADYDMVKIGQIE